MRPTASHFALVFAGMVLIAVALGLTGSQPDDCGLLDCPRSHIDAAGTSGTPTLAPPQNLVFVNIESDKPDIQVSWSEK